MNVCIFIMRRLRNGKIIERARKSAPRKSGWEISWKEKQIIFINFNANVKACAREKKWVYVISFRV